MVGESTIVGDKTHPEKTFTYDFSYWSHNPADSNFADQEKVMKDIGNVILNNALNGFNGCLFAYGQTGAGKSYSVVGYPGSPGIIPLSVIQIFEKKTECENVPDVEMRVWISYLEIYNEHIHDLLGHEDSAAAADLKVMDFPKIGVVIQGLTA